MYISLYHKYIIHTLTLKPDVIFEIFSFTLSFWGSIIPFVNSVNKKMNYIKILCSFKFIMGNSYTGKSSYLLLGKIHISLIFLLLHLYL